MNRKGGGVLPKRKIYMAVTKDALSLPLAVADSAAELAELRGVKVETIRSLISRGRTGKIKRPGYIVVEVEEDAPRTKDAPPEKKASRRKQTGEFDGEIFRERIRLLRKESGMTKKGFCRFYRDRLHHAIQLREGENSAGGGHVVSDCSENGVFGGLADWAEGGRRKCRR